MNNTFLKFGITLMMILFFQESSSQDKFYPGYIITKARDTISGYIEYKNSSRNPQEVKFKEVKEENTIKQFSPDNIVEFGVKNELYISAKVDVSSNETKTLNINQALTNVFLQTLFKGNKNLYYYKSASNHETFYIKPGEDFMLLTYKEYTNEPSIIKTNNRFKGQLILYLYDCQSIQKDIDKAIYSKNSLVKVFKKYYECDKNAELEFQFKEQETIFEKGIIFGTSTTSLKFKSSEKYLYLTANYNKSTNLSAGVFLNIILPRNEKKWSIYNELLYYSYETSNRYEDYQNENVYDITSTKIGHSLIKLNNLIRFKHPGKLAVFYNTGITNGFVLSDVNYAEFEKAVFSNKSTTKGLAVSSKKYELGFIIGTGLNYNNLSFEARFETTTGLFNENHNLNKFYFLFSYKL